MKVKVIELVGQKLDPKAKYLFLLDIYRVNPDFARMLSESLHDLIGDNFLVGFTQGDPSEVAKVYEFLPSKKKEK